MDQCKGTIERMLAVFAASAAGIMFSVTPASAANTTTEGAFCMQRVFMGPSATVSGSNLLNCTANDIRLSKAISVSPDHCTSGTTFDLTATFQVDVTANARYDAAFFFRIDGGANARGDGSAATGQCSVTQLDPSVPPATAAGQTGNDGDTCGDLNAGSYTNVTITIPKVLCQDTNGDGFLNLPNCTSWHSNQGTACTRDDNPFDANPDTKSKCVCDDTFQVPVHVETGTITVTKDVRTGTPSSLPEPGGLFEYTVTAQNTATVVSVTLDRICDDRYGTVVKVATAQDCPVGTIGAVDSTDCVLPQTLQPGGSVVPPPANSLYACHFKAAATGDPQTITDTVTVFGHDQNNKLVTGNDSAQVSISNVAPSANVVKSLVGLACADVDYNVKVTNTDSGDTSISLTSLIDSQFGDITKFGAANTKVLSTTCSVPQSIAKAGNYECGFRAHFCAASDTDFVTAIVGDNEAGSTSKDSNSLTVNVSATVGP